MPGDMESLKYVACDLEGSVSISNKQGAFRLPSGGFRRANVSPLLFVGTMFSILPFKLQVSVNFIVEFADPHFHFVMD